MRTRATPLAILTVLAVLCAAELSTSCAGAAPADTSSSRHPVGGRAAGAALTQRARGASGAACGAKAAIGGFTAPVAPGVPLQERAAVMFRVNQLAYVDSCAKLALAMVRARPRSSRFTLSTLGGRIVFRGSAGQAQRWNARYLVYPLDFTSLATSGTYVIRFAGRRSPPLRVTGMNVYRSVADATLAFVQSQRDGPSVISGSLHRRASHVGDAAAAVYRAPAYRGTRLVGHLLPAGGRVDVVGGWFDAGDYMKFVETASFTDAVLLYAARDYSAGFSDPAALAREARFGTDWLLKMWDQRQRVLYAQVGLGNGNDSTILGDHDLWRLPQADDHSAVHPGHPSYLATHPPVFAANAPGRPISPNLAGRVAADFALCAQVFARQDPAYAQRCLLAGQSVFDQADTHPRGPLFTTVPHAYYAESEWRDDMQLGATELYLATAQVGSRTPGLAHADPNFYLDPAGRWADAYITSRASGQDSFNLYDVSSLADADLVHALNTPGAQQYILHGPGSVSVPTDVQSLLQDRRDQLALATRLSQRDPFKLANPASPVDTVPHALGYAVESRLYDTLSASNMFESLAQRQWGWVLGANAWGSSFIVGIGSVFPHCLAAQIPNLSGALNGRGTIALGAVVDGPTGVSNLGGLGAPDGYRACPTRGRSDPFRGQTGRGAGYLDDVRSSDTSEPADDYAAVALLAAAQQATGG